MATLSKKQFAKKNVTMQIVVCLLAFVLLFRDHMIGSFNFFEDKMDKFYSS
jgi:hypothetical protein